MAMAMNTHAPKQTNPWVWGGGAVAPATGQTAPASD